MFPVNAEAISFARIGRRDEKPYNEPRRYPAAMRWV